MSGILRTSLEGFGDEPPCCESRWPGEDAVVPGLGVVMRTEAGVRNVMRRLADLPVDSPQMRRLIDGIGVETLSKVIEGPDFRPETHIPDRFSPIIARGLIDLLLRFDPARTDLWVQRTHTQATWSIAIDVIEALRRYISIPLDEFEGRLPRLVKHIDAAAAAWRQGDSGVVMVSRLVVDLGLGAHGEAFMVDCEHAAGRIACYVYVNAHMQAHWADCAAATVNASLVGPAGAGAYRILAESMTTLSVADRTALWRFVVGHVSSGAAPTAFGGDPGATALSMLNCVVMGIDCHMPPRSLASAEIDAHAAGLALLRLFAGRATTDAVVTGQRHTALSLIMLWLHKAGPRLQRVAFDNCLLEHMARDTMLSVRSSAGA